MQPITTCEKILLYRHLTFEREVGNHSPNVNPQTKVWALNLLFKTLIIFQSTEKKYIPQYTAYYITLKGYGTLEYNIALFLQ